MKLTELLIITWCSIIVARSEAVENEQETLLKKAAEQLERLAPFRRIAETPEESDVSKLLEAWKASVDQNNLDGKNDDSQGVPWEVLEILPEQTEEQTEEQTITDAAKRIDDEKMITIGVIADPKFAAMMQERVKRGYNAGSGSLLTSIAGGVLSGIASTSSGSAAQASVGSSQQKPVYGTPAEHTYSYEAKPFGPWDFKKAIFGTLFQALKAIGGGVIALKGQLVKGSSYLLAGKSKVFYKAGDVITSLGKKLAASAITEPKPYPPDTYYDHPPNIGHDSHYQGPLPGSDDYSGAPNDYTVHKVYGLPTDDKAGGLLIATPMKSDLDGHNEQHTNVAVSETSDLTKLEESFGGPAKGSAITNFFNSLPKGSIGLKDQAVVGQNNDVESYPPAQHPSPTYGAPDHSTNYDNPAQNYNNPVQNYEQNYVQDNAYQQPELPQTTLPHHYIPNLGDPNLSIQPSVEYSPLHVQQYQYPNPLLNSPKLPHDDGGTSVYTSLSIDTEPQISSLKRPLLDHSNDLDLPKLQPHVNFHRYPQLGNDLHGSLGGPLRISLLKPMPTAYYWHGEGSLMPTSPLGMLDHFHKRNVLHRRTLDKRLARHSLVQRMRFHQ
ncbi:uncharacterized protein [Linepithema humile]|uniref:uncharacterized protein n=1 Tax=Linepithema humile TaxID=83485 RepID=UPI00351DECA1